MVKYPRNTDIHVAVIEPSPVEREYLLALVAGAPGVTLSGAYGSPADALPEWDEDPPDMVIADLEAPNEIAATWLKQLHTALPHASVLVLSTEKDRSRLFQALEAGVSGSVTETLHGGPNPARHHHPARGRGHPVQPRRP